MILHGQNYSAFDGAFCISLIDSLKEFIPEKEALYQAVIKNKAYENVARETVYKYLK